MGQIERADGTAVLRAAVSAFAKDTGATIAFGGFTDVDGLDGVRLDVLVGNRTSRIDGLHVLPQRGLGGQALVEMRPRITRDYASARNITHDYDRHILGEGIVSLLAVPVVVSGRTRAVLYGGLHGTAARGDMLVARAVQCAADLGHELAVRDEVERRLRVLTRAPFPNADTDAPPLTPASEEDIRQSYAELRTVAAEIEDPSIRARVEAVERRLLAIVDPVASSQGAPEIRLSPREMDALACAALGKTNAQIADDLGLSGATVKSYLSSAMSKLDASTRHAAVARARRLGLLP